MSKRTNTAVWEEKYSRWRVAVQKDGIRKQFYSSTPGRTGQREANAKADRWLDEGIAVKASRVEDAGKLWLKSVELTTDHTNYRPVESRWRIWVLPMIGKKRLSSLTEQDLQDVINRAFAAGLSKKTLESIRGDMTSFLKYCRKSKLSTFLPEDVKIPAERQKGLAAGCAAEAVQRGHDHLLPKADTRPIYLRLPVSGAYRAASGRADGLALGGCAGQHGENTAVDKH